MATTAEREKHVRRVSAARYAGRVALLGPTAVVHSQGDPMSIPYSNLPPGCSDSDDYFDMPSVGDDSECSADLGAPPCECSSCTSEEAYWRNWARGQRFGRYSKSEILDCYSDATEQSKRDSLLRFTAE